jgi:signal transduction histidine kinase
VLLVLTSPDNTDVGWPEVAGAVLAFALIALRRQHTGIMLVAATLGTAAALARWERPNPLLFAVLVLLFTFCLDHDRRTSILAGTAVAVTLFVAALPAGDGRAGDGRVLIALPWTAAAVGIADATRSRRELIRSAEERLAAAVRATEMTARRERAEERLAIARELHDLLAHNLAVMNVHTAAAEHVLHTDPAQAERSLVLARTAGRTILDELRELLGVLRTDSSAEPTSVLPTFADLDALVDTVRRSGLDVEWIRRGTVHQLSPAVSLAAYRVAQEALTNAGKHGTGVAVLETTNGEHGVTIVVDNPFTTGPRSDIAGGLGLVGMRERVAAVGGHLDVGIAGHHFRVCASLPASVVALDRQEPT